LISLIIFLELIIVVGGWKYKPNIVEISSIRIDKDFTNTHAIGNVIYTDYIHLFQLAGLILLVSMIGAIVLTYRKREGIKKQSYFKQISREKKEAVTLVEVESNKGINLDD
jgi:NADH-quinone oxidoreductase subunit J